jgi:hypothetical protein
LSKGRLGFFGLGGLPSPHFRDAARNPWQQRSSIMMIAEEATEMILIDTKVA